VDERSQVALGKPAILLATSDQYKSILITINLSAIYGTCM